MNRLEVVSASDRLRSVLVNSGLRNETYTVSGCETGMVVLLSDLNEALKIAVPSPNDSNEHFIAYEAEALKLLGASTYPRPVATPELLYPCSGKPYFSMSLLPGQTFSWPEVAILSDKEKRAYGAKVGEAVHWIAQTVSLDTYWEQIAPLGLASPAHRRQALRYFGMAGEFWQNRLSDHDQHVLGDACLLLAETYY